MSNSDDWAKEFVRRKQKAGFDAKERQQELEHEKKLAAIRSGKNPPEPPSASPQTSQAFQYSPDYRSITFQGTSYTLTSKQAQIVGILHRAFVRGTPAVGKAAILGEIEAETSRIHDFFRNSPLWKTLVIPGERRGTYRLKL
jgi:hypothetical protein